MHRAIPKIGVALADALAVAAEHPRDTAADVIAAATELAHLHVPLPGSDTATRFRTFTELAAIDLALARIFEGHCDALAILAEAREPARDGLYGVWAADANRVTAAETVTGYRLTGKKRFCSGATGLTRALVTTAEGWMFDVDLHAPGVHAIAGTWPAVGMATTDSLEVEFTNVDLGAPIGGNGFYLDRPGFWHGAVGVAACWFGGALGAARMLTSRLEGKLTDHQAAHVGAIAASCAVMEQMLTSAAKDIDATSRRADPKGRERALIVRHVVEQGCQEVIERVGRAGGTSPIVFDREHAKRVADLMVYLRQHHGEADLAELGRLV
ncbi:MAG TPA: hypothetical protein VGC41_04295 [Kofleriaceae bacterium]